LRNRLGESLAQVEKQSTPLARVTTPSIEALQRYSAALKRDSAGDTEGFLRLAKNAIEIDPDFAMAHLKLAVTYEQLGNEKEYRSHLALARRGVARVSERERYLITATDFGARGLEEKALEQYRLLTELYPDDIEGWKMLGKSYFVMGRFAEAAKAYSKAAIRAPRDAQVLADLADALAMARGQNMQGAPEELVLRALQIDPKNVKALALAGSAAFDRRDFRGAVRYWERMLPLVEAGSEDARVIQSNIEEARAAAAALPKPAVAGARLQGTVRLAPELASKISPTDTLFVYARAAEGPAMPLAVLRGRAADLPLKFSLDDSMAMSPAMKLSAFPKVVVTARISKFGSATPQSGDLQGVSAPVANSGSVSITIDKVVR